MLFTCVLVAALAASATAAPAPQASGSASICFDDLDCVLFVSDAKSFFALQSSQVRAVQVLHVNAVGKGNWHIDRPAKAHYRPVVESVFEIQRSQLLGVSWGK